MHATPWTQHDDQFLIDTHASLSVRQQAERLQRTYNSVRVRRSELRARGLLSDTARAKNRPWTQAERDMLIGMLHDGLGLRTIANRMPGRTFYAIEGYCERHGISINDVRQGEITGVHTASQVGVMFGVPHWEVIRWIRRKWLYGRQDLKRAKGVRKSRVLKPYFRVTDQSLVEFIKDRRYWPAWNVECMTDPFWREFAAEQRQQAGGHWLSTPEVAAQLHYTTSTVYGWYKAGLLAHVQTMMLNNIRYFWSANLAGFVPPLERERAA
jgi:hypothetical protein